MTGSWDKHQIISSLHRVLLSRFLNFQALFLKRKKCGTFFQWFAVMGEVISKVESELLCRAYINMYLGDDPLDKDAKDKFGISLISLF
ncbi:fatty-acid-binding protein 1-like isoform X2 [Gossypium australe]|uniref:Fatty-acid-binding protein 1-like isoform X2 n=1 Tax=Gossypium australe TaxID=47621 RepID=A0A5B6UPT8_9ROSI|nr:fatty-acid-binding protein 1-like isoform X2 [Gossypium australe]